MQTHHVPMASIIIHASVMKDILVMVLPVTPFQLKMSVHWVKTIVIKMPLVQTLNIVTSVHVILEPKTLHLIQIISLVGNVKVLTVVEYGRSTGTTRGFFNVLITLTKLVAWVLGCMIVPGRAHMV